jgi:hypothetical protein
MSPLISRTAILTGQGASYSKDRGSSISMRKAFHSQDRSSVISRTGCLRPTTHLPYLHCDAEPHGEWTVGRYLPVLPLLPKGIPPVASTVVACLVKITQKPLAEIESLPPPPPQQEVAAAKSPPQLKFTLPPPKKCFPRPKNPHLAYNPHPPPPVNHDFTFTWLAAAWCSRAAALLQIRGNPSTPRVSFLGGGGISGWIGSISSVS